MTIDTKELGQLNLCESSCFSFFFTAILSYFCLNKKYSYILSQKNGKL